VATRRARPTLTRVSFPPPIAVEDPADPRLADFVGLRDAELRRRVEHGRGIFIAEGRLAIEALLRSTYEVRAVLVTPRALRQLHDALRDAPPGVRAPVYVASEDVLRATAGFDLHRGALASAMRPDDAPRDVTSVLPPHARRVLVCEGVNDHENLGSLFRNAAAFGVDAVLLDPTSADPLYRRSVRVSLGHVLRVPFARVAWPAALDALHAAGWRTVALTPAAARTVDELAAEARDERLALLVGAEGPGLSPPTLDAASERVRIPMAVGVDSLNVATAAAVALHALAPSRVG
jgi:tRNA G18 (ribose-2'-O)-methylase SpoU